MRYASVRRLDVTNGKDVGVALFVQGCRFHCKDCFNEQTWDFNGGREWTPDVENKFMELVNNPHVKRVSLLGGEPLCDENIDGMTLLAKRLKEEYPNKKIWLYTGYDWETVVKDNDRKNILDYVDIVIDGRFIAEKRDLSLMFRGSSNQRIIDVQRSLKEGKVIECNFQR